MIYEAIYEFVTDHPLIAEKSSILYEAVDGREAIRGAVRWWGGRHEAIPAHFYQLIAVKVYRRIIHSMDERGYVRLDRGICPVFEWKIDFPAPLKTYVPGASGK
ncbi:hypothetical protein LCGC14_3165180 [marine sediment metagenome]|uniref:Uncharacterized protein n=1 Tax=marine sediment metagenome TaxID=412755 RepID=A0A0F8YBW8_9ZZZZ